MEQKQHSVGFCINDGSTPGGFTMAFANGISVSVQFHTFAYCVRKPDDRGFVRNAEVAVSFNGDYVPVPKQIIGWDMEEEGEKVVGFLTPEVVAKIISWASTAKPDKLKEADPFQTVEFRASLNRLWIDEPIITHSLVLMRESGKWEASTVGTAIKALHAVAALGKP